MGPAKLSEQNATSVRSQPNQEKKRNNRNKGTKKSSAAASGEEIKRGKCSTDACGLEAACQALTNNTYTCVCPHDFTQPTIVDGDYKCPRRTVPITPSPIHNILPPMWPTNMTKAVEPDILDVISVTTTTVIAGVTLLAGVFVVAIVAICWIRKYHSPGCMSLKDKKRKTHQSATPVSLSKGLLDADRYTTNPQYFAAAPELSLPSLSVPILSKENIQFHQIIGEGCFGKVYKGELSNEFGNVETVAIKVLKESASKETEEDFMREVGVMSSFQHSNILSLLGVTYKEPEKSPCMVFEFMPHGDLTEVLRSNSRHFWKSDATVPKLNKESLLSIAIQIASGMQYLAGQHFVHRDLACRNCLVGANLTVKIADFGMSRDVYTCDYYKIGGSRLLPVRWMSPESVTYGRFTLESDIWSYGVVLWEIYSLGKQPYYGHSNEEVVKLILQGIMLIPPEDCPASICEIMETCWKTEPRDRASFTEIYDRLLQISLSSGVSHQLAVDCEDYLKPHPPKKPHEYMQPLPD